jgi:dihydrodipicolinate synthase/N-acetylneuraminate lyase
MELPACTRRQWFAALTSSAAAGAPPAAPHPLRGILIIMTTPYTDSKALDYEDLARQADYLERCGAHGMVWPQLGSEVWNLTKEERLRGMEVLAKAAKGKKAALVLGVQGPDTATALEYTRHAEALGPDALIAIPAREARSIEDVRSYYRALAQAATRPLIVQTTGGPRGMNIDAEFVAQLAGEFPHCGYVKEEAPPVLDRIRALVRRRPLIRRIYGGSDANALLSEMRAGSDGNMPNAAYADIYAQIWDLFQAGRERESRDLYARTLLLTNLRQHIPATPLYVMKKRGVFKTVVSRQRDLDLKAEEIREIEFHLEALKPYLRT